MPAGTGAPLITLEDPQTFPKGVQVVAFGVLKADHRTQPMMCQSNQTDLVSESEEFIMWRVEHLLEVAAVEQVILSYQHLQIINKQI